MTADSWLSKSTGASTLSQLIGRGKKRRGCGRHKPRTKPKGSRCGRLGKLGLPPSKKLENLFLSVWESLGGPPLQREVRLIPNRKFRVDFYDPTNRIAYEIEGGVFSGGRHTRGVGFIKDCEKYNLHLAAGIPVYRIPSPLITKEYIEWLISWTNNTQ